nr:tyrosine-type recombinase/integrase [Salsuginibacillus kocurii]
MLARESDIFLNDFFVYCESKNLSRKTIKSYDQTLRLFFIYLENEHNITDVRNTKSTHVRQYIKHLKERGKYTVVGNEGSQQINFPDHRTDHGKQIGDTTIANYLRNIKVFFNFLKEEGEIREAPTKRIENIKPKRRKKPLLSKHDLQQVLRQFDITIFHEYRTYMQMRLILDTGLRAGECCALIPADIDFRTKSMLVRNPKNHMERYVYFSHKLSRELKRWMMYRDRFSDSDFLFPTIRGTQLDVRNFEKSIRKAGIKAGVEIHPHQLRNNFAKYYLLAGGDFASLSRILGHSSIEVTQQAYLDFTDEEVGRKYQRHSPLNHLDI